MWDVLLDTLIDLAKLLPLLYLAYLAMEYMENKMGGKAEALIKKAGKAGPLIGGALGIVPQCGFSAAASGLYSGGVVTAGTLIAVFLSTSDEMLPIMISEQVHILTVLKVLGIKLVIGVAVGMLVDVIVRRVWKNNERTISDMCARENCDCEEHGIFLSALKHTLSVALFIFVVSLALNILVYYLGSERLSSLIIARPYIGSLIAAAFGLIPNCASSVMITELYLGGVISAGAMIGGLLSSSGVGLLVLFRTNRNIKSNLIITAVLYVTGAVFGVLFDALGVVL